MQFLHDFHTMLQHKNRGYLFLGGWGGMGRCCSVIHSLEGILYVLLTKCEANMAGYRLSSFFVFIN